jgi:hypothetical protein
MSHMSERANIVGHFPHGARRMGDQLWLAKLYRPDLFIYLRLLTEAGATATGCEIDSAPTIPASCHVVRCKLGERLQVILAAKPTPNLNADKVEGGPSVGRPLADSAKHCQVGHGPVLTPSVEDRWWLIPATMHDHAPAQKGI